MSNLDKSFAFVMAVEASREEKKKKKKETSTRDIKDTLVVALERYNWTYNCSMLVELDEEDIKYLYDKHKAKLKDHLLKSL